MTPRSRRLLAVLTTAAGVLLAAGCTDTSAGNGTDGTDTPTSAVSSTSAATTSEQTTSGDATGSPTQPTESAQPQPAAVTVTSLPEDIDLTDSRVIAENLQVPWGIAFLPDGDALVTERDTARLLRVSADGDVTPLGTVPGVTPTSEGGLLGVAVSPTYADDETVFIYVTTEADNRVLSGTVEDLVEGRGTPVVTGIPRGDVHNGGRVEFGPDEKLYVTTGEANQPDLAQDLESLGGKILRVNPDGSIPTDNPFDGSPVWSYGHRNVQGIAWDDEGRMWETEFGSQVWDEVNLIEPGKNYGWPDVEGTGNLEGMTNPYAVFSTFAASPSGVAYADGALWLGALQGETTWRVPVKSEGLGTPKAVRLAEARTRTVVLAPDGSLWVTTSETDRRATPEAGDDRIFEVEP